MNRLGFPLKHYRTRNVGYRDWKYRPLDLRIQSASSVGLLFFALNTLSRIVAPLLPFQTVNLCIRPVAST